MAKTLTCAIAALAVSWSSPALAEDAKGMKSAGNTADRNAKNPAVMQQANRALESIVAAGRAIDRKDDVTAKKELASAKKTLDQLYGSSPGADVVKEMDRVQADLATKERGVDFAPLTALVTQSKTFLDPEVVAGIREAEKASKEGKTDEASDALRLARQAVIADVALLPVEAAYARVVAAQTMLGEGNREDARRMIAGVPIEMAQFEARTTTPFGEQARVASSDQKFVVGHVANASKDRIEIDGKTRGMVTLNVDEQTNITIEGRKTSADQLQPGSPVFAAYEGSGDELTATRVRVDPPRTSSGSMKDPADKATREGTPQSK